MSTRLQVVMDEAELEEIRQTAERARLTTSEWVRRVLREARGPAHTPSPGDADPPAVHDAGSRYRDAPPSRSPVLVNDRLLHLVMERYRFPTRHAAVEFALQRAAEPPMTREEILAMEGTGWFGDLDEMRSGNRPPDVLPTGSPPPEAIE
jgi:Arc/MetJ family transcription regulator